MSHHEYSPSKFPMWNKCSFYDSTDEVSDYASSGTKQHELLHAMLIGSDLTNDLPEDEIENVTYAYNKILLEFGVNEINSEYKIEILLHDFSTIYGTIDVWGYNIDNQLTLVDYKSGICRDYLPQLKAYALGLMQQTGQTTCKCLTIYGSLKIVHTDIFYYDDCEKSTNETVERRKNPEKTLCEYCSWCKHKFNCTMRNAVALNVVQNEQKDALKGVISRINIKTCDNEKLAILGTVASLIEDWAADVKSEIKSRLIDNQEIPGYELKTRSGSKIISDVENAIGILSAYVPPEKLIQSCTLPLTKLTELYHSNSTEKITKAKAKETVETLIANCIEKTEDTLYLNRKK